ncbi:MAG: prepilin peptidase [Actinomycetota bacterium]
MQTILVILAIPFGLLAGGFATMLADRTLDDTPLGFGSRCPQCGASLSIVDTIPVLSWLRLGGSCRHCGASITVGYPIVEVATAVLFVWVAFRYDQTDFLIAVPLILVVAGAALSATDLYAYRLPNRLVFPAFWLSLIAMAVLSILELERPDALLGALGAAVGYSLFLFVFHLIKPAAMGFGDVKLALLLGLHTGWIGSAFYDDTRTVFRLTFWALLTGMFAYLAFSLIVTGLRRFVDADILPDPLDDGEEATPLRRKAIPLGPGLIVGALFVVLYPDAVLG